ncbi:MAG: TonB-dependent receptor [Candidatus Symbiothrix sp.]|jgi:hypothetical protein|nr:TonB-dependent receptor [Candidatus Symbiothrix sp.]
MNEWHKYLNRMRIILLFVCLTPYLYGKNDTIPDIEIREVIISGQSPQTIRGLSQNYIHLGTDAAATLPSLAGSSDMLKLLELTPGVQHSGDGNSYLYVRGSDAGQNLLLYDNAPLYSAGHLLGIFPLFNPEHLSGVELHKSEINAAYGGGLSAVVKANPRQSLPKKLQLKGNVGLIASEASMEIPLGKRFGVYLSGRKTYLNLLIQPLLNSVLRNSQQQSEQGLSYDFHDINLTLIGQLSPQDRLEMNVTGGQDKLKINEQILDLIGRLNWSNGLVSTRWEHQIDRYTLSQQLYFSQYQNQILMQQSSMDMHLLSSIREVGYKGAYRRQIGLVAVETGLQYASNRIQPQIYEIYNTQLPYSQNHPDPLVSHLASLYAEAELPLNPQWDVRAGLRYNLFFQDRTFNNIEPRISFHYQPDNNNRLHLTLNRQHQYLHLLCPTSVGLPLDFWVTASGAMPPQSGNGVSIGYFHSTSKHDWELSAEIFYRMMHHIYEYNQTITSGNSTSYLDNITTGKGKAYGLELIVKKNFGAWNGWISYTLGKSDRTIPALNNGQTFPARFDRRHDLSLVATYKFSEKWNASLVYIYATGNACTLPSSWYFINNTPVKEYAVYNGARMPDYHRTDLSLQYLYAKDNGIVLSIYNLFAVNNPLYVFMNVERNDKTGQPEIRVRHKQLFSIIPSLTWRFKF